MRGSNGNGAISNRVDITVGGFTLPYCYMRGGWVLPGRTRFDDKGDHVVSSKLAAEIYAENGFNLIR